MMMIMMMMMNQNFGDLRSSKQCHGKEITHLQAEKKGREKIELILHGETVGPKHTLELLWHFNLSDLNLSWFFLTKKEKDFGRDMTNS